MSPTEIRLRPNQVWRPLLIAAVAIVFLYFYLGYLPVFVWILLAVTAPFFVYRIIRGVNTEDPIIILDEEGVLDKRLKVGVIEWADIRRISCHSLSGAEYISLHLHDTKKYEARRPLGLKLVSQVQRPLGMSPIAISTTGLDVDTDTLANMIHEGCEIASEENVEIE
jgi:hypothetical protein